MRGVHLVTGGCGFLGRALVRRLVAGGSQVLVLDDLSSPGAREMVPEWVSHDRVSFAWVDLAKPWWDPRDTMIRWEPEVLVRMLSGIWHLASPASPTLYKARQVDTLRMGGAVLDQLLDLAGTRCPVMFASSSEVYGQVPDEQVPTPETYRGNVSTTGPRSMYDEAKRYGEALCAAYHAERGTDVRIVRIHNTYGPGMDPADGRVVPVLLDAGIRGSVFDLHGNGSQTRTFCYVDDTIDGLLAVYERGRPADPVNIGGTEEVTVVDLVATAARVLGTSVSVRVAPPQDAHDPKRRCPDLTKARTLGWAPKVGLEEGLRRTANWLRTRR